MSSRKLPPGTTEVTPLVGVKTPSGSVPIVIFTVFFQSLGFTIILPSMAPFARSLGISTTFYGWIVACYSLGQFLGSPIFGYWSNLSPSRPVIMVSLLVSAIGNCLYGFVGNLPQPGWFMLLARFLVGFGAGNIAVCRAYASEATSLGNKAATMAKLSAAQGVGFVIGPVLGYLLSFFNFHIGQFPIDQYTSPGFLSTIFGLANIVFVGVMFIELVRHTDKFAKPTEDKMTKSELIPVVISIFLFFVVVCVFSIFETMITIITGDEFGWAVKDNGILFIACGAVSVVVYIIISTPVMKRKEDRKMMMIGTSLQIIGLAFAATWSWPYQFQKRLTIEQFYIATGFIGVGYPISAAYMFAIYSKVLNPAFQGTKMGWLTAGGSFARMIGPIYAVHAYNPPDTELLFLGTDAVVIASLFILIIFWARLCPHPAYFYVNTANSSINSPVTSPQDGKGSTTRYDLAANGGSNRIYMGGSAKNYKIEV